MTRVRVKICGITRPQDAQAAVAAGADALGLVFFPPSPRFVTPELARQIRRSVPPFVTVVGLFLDAEAELVRQVLEQVPLDLAQFHGNESAAFCTAFGRPYIKAVPMSGSVDPVRYAGDHPAASGFLLDSHAPGERGGTGETFDWDRVPAQIGRPVVLAGGLGPDNVERAVRTVRPYAVDVSSGVETEPGIKSETLIQAFMRGVARGQSR